MIPVSSTILDSNRTETLVPTPTNWKKQLACGFKSARELLNHLDIDDTSLPYLINDQPNFPVKVPRFFANLIDRTNPQDPILRQIISQIAENQSSPQESNDPLNESDYMASPGLIHKYKNRALLITHQACAIHCRYCFRQEFPYQEQRLTTQNLKLAVSYLDNNSYINEIILSGGDPLNLGDSKFNELINSLSQISTIKTIRIHSRTPVVLPDRVTNELITALESTTKKIVLVLHINHSQEISRQLSDKVELLKRVGVLVLNQTVLLKDINNDPTILLNLCNDLFHVGILPYYLHTLDKVNGVSHFDIPLSEARHLWTELQKNISGYLLPRLVTDTPGEPSKSWRN